MINTGVSPSLRRPQTFHRFTYQFAARGLIPLPLRCALVGAKSSAGTATASVVYEITDAEQSDGLFGISSELALMCRKAFETGALLQQGPKIFAVAIAEPGGGTAAVKTFTSTGSASADGVAIVRVAGRTITVGIRSGDAQNTIATALSNALKTIAELLPVTVTVATNVVTLTHPTKGVNGNDIAISVEQNVAGNTIAAATPTPGVGVADPTAALDALSAMPFDAIALGNHASADITLINTDIASRWNLSEKRWRWYFLGESGSIGTATTLASAANHQAVLIGSFEGCLSTCGEISTALAMGAFSRERPNANYDGMNLPLYPPGAATVYTPTEVETAIAAGLTPLTAQIDPFTRSVSATVGIVERMITTKATQGSNPFEVLRDLAVSRTAVYRAQQFDAAYRDRFSADANPDGTLFTDDTIDQVRDMIEGIDRLLEQNNILRDVDANLSQLQVERSPAPAVGRLDVDAPMTVVVGLHQIAYVHRVQI